MTVAEIINGNSLSVDGMIILKRILKHKYFSQNFGCTAQTHIRNAIRSVRTFWNFNYSEIFSSLLKRWHNLSLQSSITLSENGCASNGISYSFEWVKYPCVLPELSRSGDNRIWLFAFYCY